MPPPVEHLRHLRLVPRAGIARQPHEAARGPRRRPGPTSAEHPAYDAFWKSRALTTWLTEVRGPDADGRRLVGPGGFLRRHHDLRRAGAPRPAQPELPGDGSVEPRQLVAGRRPEARRHRFRQRHREVLPGGDPGALVRVLAQGQGQARPRRGDRIRERQQPVAALRSLAARRKARRESSTSAPAGQLSFDRPPP